MHCVRARYNPKSSCWPAMPLHAFVGSYVFSGVSRKNISEHGGYSRLAYIMFLFPSKKKHNATLHTCNTCYCKSYVACAMIPLCLPSTDNIRKHMRWSIQHQQACLMSCFFFLAKKIKNLATMHNMQYLLLLELDRACRLRNDTTVSAACLARPRASICDGWLPHHNQQFSSSKHAVQTHNTQLKVKGDR